MKINKLLNVGSGLKVLFVSALLCTGISAFAATETPSCTFVIDTPQGSVTTQKSASILLGAGEQFTLNWSSKNATRASNINNETIPLSGSVVRTPRSDTSYTYYFASDSKKVACKVSIHSASATIEPSSLLTQNTKPTLTGTAAGTSYVYVTVTKKGQEKVLITSKKLAVKKGEWEFKIPKKLAKGEYTVEVLGDKKYTQNQLTSETLTIGKVAAVAGTVPTTLVLEVVPLLLGGQVKAGQLVPFSYLQVLNVGTKAVTLEGFTIAQNGSTPNAAIMSLSSVDDTGLQKSSIDGVSGDALFKNGTAFLPTKTILLPGQMHLYTLKVALRNDVQAFVATQLKLAVASVRSDAQSVKGAFPIRGVTWTIAK